MTMRAETERRCAAFNDRIQTASFDIQSNDWYPYLDGADVVVSSLCVHHLDGAQKQRLFRTIAERISSRGVLLIADLIAPKRTQSLDLFAATWDQVTRDAAGETGKAAVDLFEAEQWNIFRYPDDFDKPSPLSDQLLWLTDAGFSDVDCFWLNAGHAIYGGYRRNASSNNIPYEMAVQVAHASLFGT
jgi:tRNA (cmo5U34)-methyltransferase